MNFDTAVLIGRFQPFHNGHHRLLTKALSTAPQVVIVLGSAFSAPSVRNPFSASQREAMIRSALSPADNSRLHFHPQRDVWDGVLWAQQVQGAIEELSPGKVALVGYHKDHTSEYLNTFPSWTLVDAGRQGPLDATPLRERILSHHPWPEVESELRQCMPESVVDFLTGWALAPIRSELAQDLQAIVEYRTRWGKGPFLTVDAVVSALDHVLLIRRGARPGKGLLALPGGFLEPDETFEEGARRELQEETGLELTNTSAVRSMQFAHPGRAARARIVTQASLFQPSWTTLPEVKGSDDAEDARWIPLQDLLGLESHFFGDHFHILDQLLGVLPKS